MANGNETQNAARVIESKKMDITIYDIEKKLARKTKAQIIADYIKLANAIERDLQTTEEGVIKDAHETAETLEPGSDERMTHIIRATHYELCTGWTRSTLEFQLKGL